MYCHMIFIQISEEISFLYVRQSETVISKLCNLLSLAKYNSSYQMENVICTLHLNEYSLNTHEIPT